jgi:hypothetical protein
MVKNHNKAAEIAKTYKGTIKIDPLYKQFLKDVIDETSKVPSSKQPKEAQELLKLLGAGTKQTKPQLMDSPPANVDATTVLKLRRFIDRLTKPGSWAKEPVSRSLSQQGLINLSGNLRGKLEKIPEFASTMKDYKFYIDAFEAIGKYAKKAQNSKLFTLLDGAPIGIGALMGEPVTGAIIAAGARAARSPRIGLGIAQTLTSGPTVKKEIGKAISRYASSNF